MEIGDVFVEQIYNHNCKPWAGTFGHFCEEIGFVNFVHLLSSEVRSFTTALKFVEEVQEEVQEEVGWNGELKIEEKR